MSKLDQYISKLLGNDNALKAFLQDPKGEAKDYGLSKADGSILRRSIQAIPATAKSGLAITRPLSSYRSSLRLLQNVLHNFHGHKLGAGFPGIGPVLLPSILIYYNATDSNWPKDSLDNPHSSYVNHVYAFYKNNNTSARTIGEAMGFQPIDNPMVGQQVTGTLDSYSGKDTIQYTATYQHVGNTTDIAPYISEFVINGQSFKISLDGVTVNDRDPFWFYSINGNVLINNGYGTTGYGKNPDADYGAGFQSFADYPLPQGGSQPNTITWQAIAPDQEYGFAPCTYGGN